ncbi:MAG: DUF4249 domain-containing protein [Ignavibacteria bacterium]|nr:DUF4249 domain-containing protein [Ignavibacteria bacterium]
MRRFVYSYILILGLLLIIGCEDAPPTDYIPQYYVEAFLIVDEPFERIKILRTQPLTDTFDFSKAFVKNADVSIKYNGKEIKLLVNDSGDAKNWCYYYPDTSLKVLPTTTYYLEIVTPDGKTITSSTTTPERFEWVLPPPDTIYYPKDTVNFSDKPQISIRWKSVKGILYYIVSTKCLDTLEYGKYLFPQSDEKNRRIYNPWDDNRNRSRYYYDVTNWDAIPNTEYPLYWLIFKWFGKHKIIVYSPDFNFLRWILQQFRGSQINPLLSSVSGAIGVFGSASKVEKDVFLVKNQP